MVLRYEVDEIYVCTGEPISCQGITNKTVIESHSHSDDLQTSSHLDTTSSLVLPLSYCVYDGLKPSSSQPCCKDLTYLA